MFVRKPFVLLAMLLVSGVLLAGFSAVYAAVPHPVVQCFYDRPDDPAPDLVLVWDRDFYLSGDGPGLPSSLYSSRHTLSGPGIWTNLTADGGKGVSVNLGDFQCGEPEDNGFDPGDDRLNVDPGAPVVIYEPDEGGITIYTVDGESNGHLSLDISDDDLADLPEHPEHNILVAESDDGFVRLYLLTDGEYQVSAGPDSEGKEYSFIFSY